MKAVKGKISMQKHTFELFGYDFIFDEELNTILIEVNTNPCLEESNHLLKRILPRMIDDLLNITMDPLFGINGATENHNGVGPNGKYKSSFKLSGDVFGDPVIGHPGYPFLCYTSPMTKTYGSIYLPWINHETIINILQSYNLFTMNKI